jgi:mRNA interferase RelE/StbE
MNQWRIVVADEAMKQLKAIKDNRIKTAISKRIDELQWEPDKQGKALEDNLAGYRSVRAVGQRYRIIYQLQDQQVIVSVVTVGIRKEGDTKDAYAMAKKLARLNLLDNRSM